MERLSSFRPPGRAGLISNQRGPDTLQRNKPLTAGKATKATPSPTRRGWHQMNRKQRKELARRIQAQDLSLEVVHADAAGIDIGNDAHYVAVPRARDSQAVRRFGCTTAE